MLDNTQMHPPASTIMMVADALAPNRRQAICNHHGDPMNEECRIDTRITMRSTRIALQPLTH